MANEPIEHKSGPTDIGRPLSLNNRITRDTFKLTKDAVINFKLKKGTYKIPLGDVGKEADNLSRSSFERLG